MCPCAIHSIRDQLLLGLASKMPILFSSDNRRPGAAPFRSLSQASQYATLLPALYPSTSSFSSNVEHLLQVGNLHLKHLYLVLMKQEQHISITLCDVSNDLRHSLLVFSSPEVTLLLVLTKRSTASGGENAFPITKLSLYSACSSGGKQHLADGGVCIFVTFAQSITFE